MESLSRTLFAVSLIGLVALTLANPLTATDKTATTVKPVTTKSTQKTTAAVTIITQNGTTPSSNHTKLPVSIVTPNVTMTTVTPATINTTATTHNVTFIIVTTPSSNGTTSHHTGTTATHTTPNTTATTTPTKIITTPKKEASKSSFSVGSFFGGAALALGLVIIAFVAVTCYKRKATSSYNAM